ncbi:hypothetical protein KSP39_PZI012089 [Platanthera zijinensis]|uniref:Uncharacterized protein n=1 Tax=Platanthera zijinensis TaxID=2320716 RepID=A0AAP0G4W5_9ASPA
MLIVARSFVVEEPSERRWEEVQRSSKAWRREKFLLVLFGNTLSGANYTTEEDVNELQWRKDEDFCRDYLLNSLNPRLALTYNGHKTAKEIWDRLNAHFQKEEGLSRTLLGEKLFTSKFNLNSSITSQIIELESLRLKLADDKSDISDNIFVCLILSKLPPEWLTFKTEMHRLKEKIALDELKRFIHIEDQNIAGKRQEQGGQSSQTLNFVSRPSKPRRKPPAPKSEATTQLLPKKPSFKKKRGKCHNCGKWGHWAADCKAPKKKEEAPQNVANMLADASDPKSFVAMIGSSHRSSSAEWWLDSGATCHVTNDRGLLAEVKAVQEKVENCNGGETQVTHVGTAELVLSSDEAFETFKTFKSRVENQLNLKIKRFRSDRGGEYTVTGFKEFCASEGIILETTAPYSPQSNGVAERKNRTLIEMLNSMLLTAGMPNSFWGEAVRTANHILNRVPHSQLTSTPYELWHGHPCRYDTLKTWGCIAYVRIQDLKRPKVGPRTTTCVYLGSAEDSAADRFLDLSTNTVIESRDVIFFEDKFVKDHSLSVFGSNDMISESIVEPEAGSSGTAPQPLEVESVPLRASTRERIPKNFGENFVTYHLEDDPFSYQEAMRSRDSLMWAEAIDDEMDSLLHNNTWHLVDLPKGAKVLGCKWVLKKKLHSDGSIARILLALASIEDFIVHQMDVKTAFLNGELDEDIYMAQPEGYVQKDQKDKVCKLDKSIYGLKQAPKMWHMKFDQVVKSLGFQSSLSDKCLYHRSLSNQTVIICLYVDDMLILRSNLAAIRDIKSTLAEAFDMKDLGPVDTLLGKEHWEALDRLLRYLRGTKDHALCYTGYPPTVEGHSDASWCSEAGNNKSTSGYIFTLGGAAITWKSKRQTCIALSSMEAELFALALAGEEADWIRNLILDIPLSKLQVNSLSLYCDNQAAVQVVKNALYNTKRRHVRLRHALLNYLKEQGIITLIDVRSKDNLADPLTKGMPKDRLIKTGSNRDIPYRITDIAAVSRSLKSFRLKQISGAAGIGGALVDWNPDQDDLLDDEI